MDWNKKKNGIENKDLDFLGGKKISPLFVGLLYPVWWPAVEDQVGMCFDTVELNEIN